MFGVAVVGTDDITSSKNPDRDAVAGQMRSVRRMLRAARPDAPANPLQREPIANEIMVKGRRVLDALRAGEDCRPELERLHALSTLAGNLDQAEQLFGHAVAHKKRSAKGGGHPTRRKGIQAAVCHIIQHDPDATIEVVGHSLPTSREDAMTVEHEGRRFSVYRGGNDRVYEVDDTGRRASIAYTSLPRYIKRARGLLKYRSQ